MAGFPMTPVDGSDAIAAHGYDMNTRKMRVTFKGKEGQPGGTYEYNEVPPERYAAFTGSNSLGGHFAKRIAPLHLGRRVK